MEKIINCDTCKSSISVDWIQSCGLDKNLIMKHSIKQCALLPGKFLFNDPRPPVWCPLKKNEIVGRKEGLIILEKISSSMNLLKALNFIQCALTQDWIGDQNSVEK